MSHSIVTITAVDEIVKVGSDGAAQHVFTIRNDTGAPIKVGIQVLADEPVSSDWLSVDEPERELDENAADQVTVSVNAPPDLAPGRYAYRIRVYSIKQPGEEFTEGEQVAFEVAEKARAPVEVVETKKCGWCIPAAIVAAVLVLGVGGYFVYDKFVDNKPVAKMIAVKDYHNWQLTSAINDLVKKGLVFDAENLKTVWKDAKSVSRVIDQQPKPGEKVLPHTSVAFTVGKDKSGYILNLQQAKVLKLANPKIFMQIKGSQIRAIEPESE